MIRTMAAAAATAAPSTPMSKEEELYWLALRMTPGLGARRSLLLLQQFRTPQAVFAASKAELEELAVAPSVAQSIISGCAFEEAVAQQDRMRRGGVHLIPIHDGRYPAPLKQIFDPPVVLYAKGRLELLNTLMLAVVGTRRPTPYGEQVTARLAGDLAAAGLTIASGMARGIDTQAHQAALDRGGNTVAVFGSGVDHVYPTENKRLAERLMADGLVLSEFPMGTPGYPQNFPERNRVVAGLSIGVLVVEGAQYSGSGITARLALEQGRDVFAVPGNITSKASWGPNLLIKQGAKLVQDAADVLDELNAEARQQISAQGSLFGGPGLEVIEAEAGAPGTVGNLEDAAMATLRRMLVGMIPTDVPVGLDEVIERCEGWSSSEVIAMLFDLELSGDIRQLVGKRFLRVWK